MGTLLPPIALTGYDAHGRSLYTFACMLTDDVELAEQMVFQTMIAHQSAPSTLRKLSAGVYVAWRAWEDASLTDQPSTAVTTGAGVLSQIRGLPADQRVVLGLCRYGGHTYRDAAEVLGYAPERAARLLGDALRSMGASLVVGPHTMSVG